MTGSSETGWRTVCAVKSPTEFYYSKDAPPSLRLFMSRKEQRPLGVPENIGPASGIEMQSPEQQFKGDKELKFPCWLRVPWIFAGVLLYLPSAEFAGEWKITSYFQEDNHPPVTNKFKIIVKKETRVVPNYIWINTDYFIHAELDLNGKNVTNCTLLTPTSQEIDLLNDGTKNLQRFGRCGFRALVNDKSQNTHTWKLKAFVEEDKIFYTGGVDVNVFKKEKRTEEEITITLNLGTSGTVSLPVYRTIIFCQLEDPMGLKTPFLDSCVYHIPVVTPRHQGVWIARYGGMEHPVPTVQRFRVVTRDPVSSVSNVIVTESNEIQLSCHIYDEVPMSFKFCHFVRPDEYVLNLRNGIGTEGYSSFNTFEGNNTHIYCGLIIHEPKQHDYGAWKCNVKLQGNRYRGSIIYVDPRIMSRNETQNATREFHIVTENVHVKRNDFFEIKCTVDAVLDYCWFRSPNGTLYTVIPNQRQSPTNLFYVGLGFNFGECVAAIDRASYTDHGEWTCNVGIVDGPEESKTVLVNVAESYVIPERTELVANYKEDTILSCNILPNITDKDIHYCRWVRPDGHGIHHSLGPRYTTNRSNTGCKLMIAELDEHMLVNLVLDASRCTRHADISCVHPASLSPVLSQIHLTDISLHLAFLSFVSCCFSIQILPVESGACTLFPRCARVGKLEHPRIHGKSKRES